MNVQLDPLRIQAYVSMHRLENMFTDISTLPLQIREYDKGETILTEGDVLDGIYIQVEGQAKVSSSVETGKSLLLRFCHPVSIFGDLELAQRLDVQSHVEAVEACTFLFIQKQFVEQYLMQDYRFLNELLRHLAYKLHTCTVASRVNLLASVEERFATYLLSTRIPGEFGKELKTPHTSEIAAVIGTTQRHLNRLVQKLADQGILSKKRNGLVVLDWERLDEMSQGIRYD